jgi:D-ribose pyranase
VKRQGILNPRLAAALAEIGHGDAVVLADAGVRIPSGANSIHLELTCGVPTMPQVVEAVLTELVVEKAIVASEFTEWNPDVFAAVRRLLPAEPDSVAHEELMAEMAAHARLYVKTGECSAYASVIHRRSELPCRGNGTARAARGRSPSRIGTRVKRDDSKDVRRS